MDMGVAGITVGLQQIASTIYQAQRGPATVLDQAAASLAGVDSNFKAVFDAIGSLSGGAAVGTFKEQASLLLDERNATAAKIDAARTAITKV
jgi:hypothetical protein